MADMLVVDPNDEKGQEAARSIASRWLLRAATISSTDMQAAIEAGDHIVAAFFEAADTKPTTHEIDRGMLLGVRAAERWVTSWEEVADG